MAKKMNEYEQSEKGCRGAQIGHTTLIQFLDANFRLNEHHEQNGDRRFAQCVWGNAGLGKTMMVETFRNRPVVWRGTEFKGYHVQPVPIAQFEEMGDLHGMPMTEFLMRNNGDQLWVSETGVAQYQSLGWQIDATVAPRTKFAPPDWVPREPGPSILLLDDWNRASIRIIKGIMQLLQNYGMVSWALPPGCNIVLTGNPDEQSYLVTSIDSAITTRIKHVTLMRDEKAWAVWAEASGIDPRVISYVLRYPEMMCVGEMTNPRTLAEFGRFLRTVESIEDNKEKVMLHGKSLLEPDTVTSFMIFATRDMGMIVEPQQILDGDPKAAKYLKGLMERKEKRIDIVNVTLERLFAHMVQPASIPDDKKEAERRKKNFQAFIEQDWIPVDMRHSFCNRLLDYFRDDDEGRSRAKFWILGSKRLMELILETLNEV